MAINHNIIKGVWITEKSVRLSELGQYVFEVNSGTNKNEIKKAVAEQYKVHPIRVNIINREGKTKGFGKLRAKSGSLAKAIVTLKPGEKIDLQ